MDGKSFLGEVLEFVDEVRPPVQKAVEFRPLGFVVEGSLGVEGHGGSGGCAVAVSSTVELRWKMAVASAFFMHVLSTRFELWESPLRSVQIVDLSLLSSSPSGANLLLEQGESLGEEIRVSVEREVTLVDVHSRVWVIVSHLFFSTVDTVLRTVNRKMRLDRGHPWAKLLFMK